MQFKHLFLTITFLSNLLLTGFAQEPVLLEHGSGVRAVAFSPVDNNLLASAGENNTIKLWNLRRGTARTLKGHTDVVNSIAFSPNGRLLASVSHDRTIKLWTVHNQQNIATLREGTQFRAVTFSPDGKMLATAGWMHVKLWNVVRGEVVGTLMHEQQVQTVDFSPDGKLLAVGDGQGDAPGTVKVWNLGNQKVIATLVGDPKLIRSVTFSSDNRILVSAGWDGQVKVWDVSNWQLLRTIPRTGYFGITLSPDGKVILSGDNEDVNLWWVNDGSKVAQLTLPTHGFHAVDFSHDGMSFVVSDEDGVVRVWRIDTSLADAKGDAVQILHIDTYFQQLPKANSVNGNNIPDPIPPPAVIRAFFELDPYYEQWINVRGLPVIAPAKVNPYAVKEAAWVIEKMIGHRPDVLRAMVSNRARFSVVAHTDIITEIPEYRDVGTPDFLAFWARGGGGSEGATVSSSEENILAFPGEAPQEYNVQIHEFAHGIHILGLNTLDPTFDERLQMTYEAAMKKGLWQGTYASSDKREYWAESTQAWFHHNTPGSFKNLDPIRHTTRQALKLYDPELATLLAEVYGDRQWRYTPVETRTHLPHLQGFNPQDSPIFEGWSELEETYRQLKNPNSDGNGAWANLKLYDPNQLSHLTKSSVLGDQTTFVCVNLSQTDVLLYRVYPDGTEEYWTRVPPDTFRVSGRVGINEVWLIKDVNDRNLALFQTVENAGRALIGSPPQKTVSEPQVLIAQSQRPPMYWINTETGTLHRLVDTEVEDLVPRVRNATSLAVDVAGGKLYWTEKTSNRSGRIRRANFDGTNVQLVKNLTSVPDGIALDTADGRIYLTNSWGKVQRLNVDGSNFQPNLITGLESPKGLALDVSAGKVYWTEASGRIRRANLDGSNIEDVVTVLRTSATGLVVFDNTVYWTVKTGGSQGEIRFASLGRNSRVMIRNTFTQGFPVGIAVDAVENKLYWTTSNGAIGRQNLDGSNLQSNFVTGLGAPGVLALSVETPVDIETKEVPVTDAVLSVSPSPVISPAVGEQLMLNLKITAGKAVAGYQFTVQFDPTALRYVESSNGEYLPTGAFFVQPVVNRDRVELAAVALAGVSKGDGTLATITFEVLAVKASTLTLSEMLLSDSQGNTFLPQVEGGEITEPPKLKGDVNGDGVVNIQDLVLVASSFGKTGQDTADINGDGVVNIADLVLVAGSLGTGLGAPSLYPGALEMFTAADVHEWLSQAHRLNSSHVGYQRGMLVLEQLLAALTPKETILLVNYPNPFNPETWIPYQLSKPADVMLTIYAVNGQMVRRLALGHQPAGIYQTRDRAAYWDGKNEYGEPVASSVYFYTLTAGGFAATRKMLIRK